MKSRKIRISDQFGAKTLRFGCKNYCSVQNVLFFPKNSKIASNSNHSEIHEQKASLCRLEEHSDGATMRALFVVTFGGRSSDEESDGVLKYERMLMEQQVVLHTQKSRKFLSPLTRFYRLQRQNSNNHQKDTNVCENF